MNRGRFTTLASAVASVAIGLTIGLTALSGGGASASTRDAATGSASSAHVASTALTASAAAPKFVLINCLHNPVVAPSSISNCGDGAIGAKGLHWTSWNSHLASGFGTWFQNDCVPICAQGHFHNYPALIVLWGSGAVAGHPTERKFTRMTLIFTGTRPPSTTVVNGKVVTTHPVSITLPTFS